MDPKFKRVFVIAFGIGVGIAVVLSVIAAGVFWYLSRPKPPELWNTAAIRASGPPGFKITNEVGKISFKYSLENATNSDYDVTSDAAIKVVVKDNDNTLSESMPSGIATIEYPVFIPAKQKGTFVIVVNFGTLPPRKPTESDEQYHETLRAYLQDELHGSFGLVVFDETNRYEIDLPKPLAQPPAKTP